MTDRDATSSSALPVPPPKYLSRHVRHVLSRQDDDPFPTETGVTFAEANGSPMRLRSASGTERDVETLPVLRAFQEFLDGERRRARHRMLFMTAFFAAVLVAVVSAGLYVGMIFMGQIRGDVDDLYSQVRETRQATDRSRKEDVAALTKIRSETAEVRDSAQTERAALAAATAEIRSGLAAYTNGLSDLEKAVAMLKAESAGLKGDLADLRAAPPQSPVEPSTRNLVLTLPITPRGSEQSFPWRVLLPEP